ncbi:hypothetical protein M758_2G097100 [Ceratodon purpureus]|nr:hypothetical protein M758_2G097100 [Ceratodon purpureus]
MAGQVYPSAGSPLPPPATYTKRHHRSNRGGLAGCCCCFFATLCSLLVTLILLLGIAVLVLWLVLRPIHLPKYSLDNVDVRSFSVGQGSTLNANIVYNITANNPNRKIGIKYDAINLETSYDGQVFGHSAIPAFYQGHQNITSLASELNATNFPLRASSATALASQIQSNSVPLFVRADAKVRVKIGSQTSSAFWVRVDCDVVVGVKPGQLISKSCRLKRRS